MIFLWALALVFIVFAIFQDLKTREIANWINFSLIIFALGFRFFYSLFSGDGFSFFYQGIIGFGIFFILGNLFYYSRVFAGGDAKLMIALGTILPYYSDFFSNVILFVNFLLIFLSCGFFYILIASTYLCIKNFKLFKKEFSKQFKEKRKLLIAVLLFSIFFLILGFFLSPFFILGVFLFLIFPLYLYSKAIDTACMIREISSIYLREGDWLYSDVKIGKNVIKASWDGLSKKDIKEIRKKFKKIKIRKGIPFSPTFLFSLLIFILLIIFNANLWDSFW
jgi:Flp pilus assembly protein protease CpaA